MDELNNEFLEEVNKEGAKHKEYLEVIQRLGKENEQMKTTVHQEISVLYRK
jgi:hypothetical protein